jgi:hypothetical protein
MGELADDTQRGAAERLATVAAAEPKLAGDLLINATWDRGADLDLTRVAPDGTRVSWQGGRSDVIVNDATATDREELAIKTLRRGKYLVEITRGDAARSPVRGTLDITVLGVKKALPFELVGTHGVVGHIDVSLVSHLEEVDASNGEEMAPVLTARVMIGAIPDEATNRVIRSRVGTFRACYQRVLSADPSSRGNLSVILAVDPTTGRTSVQRSTPMGAGMDRVGACMTSNLARLRFPLTTGTFAVQFAFSPN